MITVKNLTNSPIDMPTEDGNVWIAAFDEATGNFAGEYYDLMLLVNALEVVSTDAKAPKAEAPAKSVEAKPAEKPDTKHEANIDQLRADYLSLVGKKPHHKLSAAKLQAAIDEALAK